MARHVSVRVTSAEELCVKKSQTCAYRARLFPVRAPTQRACRAMNMDKAIVAHTVASLAIARWHVKLPTGTDTDRSATAPQHPCPLPPVRT